MIRRRVSRVIAGLIVTSLVAFSDLTAQPSSESKTQSYAPTITKEALLSPPKDGGPVVINAAFHLQDINEIDDEAETFQFTGGLWLRWKDRRQAFDPNEAGVNEKIYQGNFQFNEIYQLGILKFFSSTKPELSIIRLYFFAYFRTVLAP